METILTVEQIKTLFGLCSRFAELDHVHTEYIDGDWKLVKLMDRNDTELHAFELDGEGEMHPRSYVV